MNNYWIRLLQNRVFFVSFSQIKYRSSRHGHLKHSSVTCALKLLMFPLCLTIQRVTVNVISNHPIPIWIIIPLSVLHYVQLLLQRYHVTRFRVTYNLRDHGNEIKIESIFMFSDVASWLSEDTEVGRNQESKLKDSVG